VISLFYMVIIPITLILFLNPSIDFTFKILPISVFSALFLVFLVIVSKNSNKIQNYIEITKDGKVLIKDKLYEKEFYDYQVSKKIKDALDIDKFPCPKCGTLLRDDIDFCNTCGIDLRTYDKSDNDTDVVIFKG
jgi:predicted RNA-binding Zn-ribbon protein involved in translation (DUF1610 family)